MKRQKICPVCNNALEKGEASFAFPRLPASNRYRRLSGIVHVTCLTESSETETIRKELTEVLGYSPHPVIRQDGNILILNHERDKCLVVYDFEDFAIFPIPYKLISDIFNTYGQKELNLDVNGFLKLLIDNDLRLNILKPFSKEQITLSSLPLKKLKTMLNDFLAEKKAEEAEKILIIWQLFTLQSVNSHSRRQDMALPSSLLSSKINDKKFLNNNLGRGQVGYGRI
jgi:hypothetical protein